MSETDIVARLRWLDKATRMLLPYWIEPGEMTDVADRLERQASDLSRMREALEPFANSFIAENVDENGWTSTVHREPISTWFGPSDFRLARAALSPAETE